VNTVLVEQIDCTLLLELLVWGFKGGFSVPQSVEKLWKSKLKNQELLIRLVKIGKKIMIREVFWGYFS
jgi:hypothetical protein